MSLPAIGQTLEWYSEEALSVAGSYTTPRRNPELAETVKSEPLPHKLPYIVIKDHNGKELDLRSLHQQAIYEARWKVSHDPKPATLQPEEWRLPHSLLPARPDYTRGVMVNHRVPREKRKHRRTDTFPLSKSVEDLTTTELVLPAIRNTVSYQNLDTLGEFSSLVTKARLRKTYLPFVEQAILHLRYLSETDHRIRNFAVPEFCYGCRQYLKLCNGGKGCQTSKRHSKDYNPLRDRPVRIGGGYSYFRRDGPPPYKEPEKIVKKFSNVPSHVYYTALPPSEDEKNPMSITIRSHLPTGPPCNTPVTEVSKQSPIAPPVAEIQLPELVEEKKTFYKVYKSLRAVKAILHERHLRHLLFRRLHRENKIDTSTYLALERATCDRDSYVSMYKAPKAFTVKPREKKVTISESPFSKNRELNINYGEGFTPKKNTKPTTDFIDFAKLESTYKEPKKFELKTVEREPIQEWKPPPQAVIQAPKQERAPTPKSPSPPPQPVQEVRLELPQPSPVPSEETPLPPSVPREITPVSSREPPSPSPEPEVESPIPPAPSVDSGVQSVTPVLEPQPEPTPTRSEFPSVDPQSEPALTPEPIDPTPVQEPRPETSSSLHEVPIREPTPPPPQPSSPPKSPTPEPEPVCEVTQPVKETTPPPPSPPPPAPPAPSPPPSAPKEPTPDPVPIPPPEPPKPPVRKEVKKRKKPVKKMLKVMFQPPAPPSPVGEESTMETVTSRELSPRDTPQSESPISLSPEPEVERELSFEFEIIRENFDSEPEPSPSPVATPREWQPPSPLPPTPVPAKTLTPPPLPDPELEMPLPRKRRPRPRILPKKNREKKKRKISATAPVTKKELKQIGNPLDYLAKYCIIHPDRLPVYERIFNKAVAQQDYKHEYVPVVIGPDDQLTEEELKTLVNDGPGILAREFLEDQEKQIKRELELLRNFPQYQKEPGTNVEDFEVAKITYILNRLYDRYDEISHRLDEIEFERQKMVLTIAKKKFPELKDPDWNPNKTKTKKKSKMDKYLEQAHRDIIYHDVPDFSRNDQQQPPIDVTAVSQRRRVVTDLEILERLESDPKLLQAVCEEAPIKTLDVEADRCSEKLRDINERMDLLEDERKVAQVLSKQMDDSQLNILSKPADFRRRQSALFNKFNPDEDVELNFEEVEDALNQINGHLISKQELQYIYNILDLPGRKKINLKMFGCVAALSEKVTQVDPFIKKLINKFDYEALDIKMERSKELFCLLCEEDDSIPDDLATMKNLIVELSAGGLSKENIDYVSGKFDRGGRGTIEYLDFLTYVPLFIEIHGRIVSNPLDDSRIF